MKSHQAAFRKSGAVSRRQSRPLIVKGFEPQIISDSEHNRTGLSRWRAGGQTTKPLTAKQHATLGDLVRIVTRFFEAPRRGLNPNCGFVELGAFLTKRLRRLRGIEMFQWNTISDQIQAESEAEKPIQDRMRPARYYRLLLDSGDVSTRAELARYFGVTQARVTQVLNRAMKRKLVSRKQFEP